MASFDNADMLEKAINQAADRICNRLDNIANALVVVCRYMESDTENASKHAERTTKLLEEIKANGTLQQGTQQSIKHELQKAVYRRNRDYLDIYLVTNQFYKGYPIAEE